MNILVRVKSNLGPTGDGIPIQKELVKVDWFGDVVPRSIFGNPILGRVQDLLAKPGQLHKGAKLLAAEQWIKNHLEAKGGIASAKETRTLALSTGFSDSTFQRAVNDLEINKIGPANEHRLYALPTSFDDLLGL